jgi:hypothetical protein
MVAPDSSNSSSPPGPPSLTASAVPVSMLDYRVGDVVAYLSETTKKWKKGKVRNYDEMIRKWKKGMVRED